MANKIKKHPYLLLASITSLILGIFLLLVNPSNILDFLYLSIGFMVVMIGVSKLYTSNQNQKALYDGALDILIGILFIFFHNFIITMILGLLFLVFPIIRILKSSYKGIAFKSELPLLILGLVMIFSGDLLVSIFVKVLGVFLIVLAIYLFISIFIDKLQFFVVTNQNVESSKTRKREDIVDVTYEERER
jgi:uncharacterized membrane protein HdeD (DUF308 family)